MESKGIVQGKWITVKHAARLLGVSKQRVYSLVKSGHLGWMKMDGFVLVTMATVEARMKAKEAIQCVLSMDKG